MEHDPNGIAIDEYNGISYLKPGYCKCYKCGKVNKEEFFISGKSGKMKIGPCKDCIKEEVGNDMIKALPYLDLYDVPLFPDQWKHYVERTKGKSVIVKYINYARLFSFREMNFTDSLSDMTQDCSEEEIQYIKKSLIEYFIKKINKNLKGEI